MRRSFSLSGVERRLLCPCGALFGLIVDEIDFRSILIIVEQAVELQRKHPLQQIFGRKPRKFAQHSRQILVDFVLVDVDPLKAVGKVIELLLYDMFGCGHFEMFEFLAYDALYFTQASFFARMDYGY